MSGLIPAYTIASSRLNLPSQKVTVQTSQPSQFSHFDTFVRTHQAEPLFGGNGNKKNRNTGFLASMTKASFGPQIEKGKRKIEERKQAAVDRAVEDTTTTVRAEERAVYQPQITDLQTTNARLAEERDEQFDLGVESVQDEIDRLSPDSHLRYSKDHFWTAHDKHQRRQLQLMQDARAERHAQAPELTFERMWADPTSYFGEPRDYAYPTPILPAILAPQPVFVPQTPGFIVEEDDKHSHSGAVPRLMAPGENDGDDLSELLSRSSQRTKHSRRSSRAHHSHRSKRDDSDSEDTVRQDRKTSGTRSVASSHPSRKTNKVREGYPDTYPIIGYTRSGDTIRQRDGSTIWHVVDRSGEYTDRQVTQYTDITGRVHINHARLAELAAGQAEPARDYILVINEDESRRRRRGSER